MSRAVYNTVMGGASGGIVVLFLNKFVFGSKTWSYLITLNGTLAGMVAQVN